MWTGLTFRPPSWRPAPKAVPSNERGAFDGWEPADTPFLRTLDPDAGSPPDPASSSGSASVDALDSCWERFDQCGRLILTGDATIRACNRTARAILDDGFGARDVAGRLHLTSSRARNELDAQLARGHAGPFCMLAPARAAPDDAAPRGRLLLRLGAIDPPPGDSPGRRCDHAVVLRRILPDAPTDWVCLEQAFGLTATEALVIRRLLGGSTPGVIAATLGISIHTVRTHIARVYGKTDVSSREELWKVCGPFRL